MTLVRVMKLCFVFHHTGSVYYYTVSFAWWSVEWGQTRLICCFSTGLYNITNSRGKVAEFCLFKQAYHIGDDIIGTCDFSSASVPCVQVRTTGVYTICTGVYYKCVLFFLKLSMTFLGKLYA